MLGVFMRRWKPKRSNNERNDSPGTDSSISPEPPDRPPLRNNYPAKEDPSLITYENTYRRNMKTYDDDNMNYQPPIYPIAPNICVEGGKIEFMKTPNSSVRNSITTPPGSPTVVLRTNSSTKRAVDRLYEYSNDCCEKYDSGKELLEKRIKQLEFQLEEEKRRTQREKITVSKLHNKLTKRESQTRSDAERERRVRNECETRAKAAESEAAKIASKLHAAQREIARMEETVHSLLQYKTRAETLKQEKTSLASTLEAKNSHYQSQLARLTAENESLRGQLVALSAGLDGEYSEPDNYEKCLDDVAHQVVRALLSQKGLREELGCMRSRVRELEAQNAALSTLLVRQLKPHPRPSPATPNSPSASEQQMHALCYDIPLSCRSSPGSLPPPEGILDKRASSSASLISFKEDSPPPPQGQLGIGQLSSADKRRHRILAELWSELRGLEVTPQSLAKALGAVDPALFASPERPITLQLNVPSPSAVCCLHRKSRSDENNDVPGEEEQAAGSPESGNKDEGYSTMSSDVQADSSRQSEHNRELEDLKEASDETDNQTIVSVGLQEARAPASNTLTPERSSVARYSFPPARVAIPFKAASRSFSDSHLCLSFGPGIETRFSIFSSAPSSGGVIVLELAGSGNGGGSLAGVESSQYDAEYVRHWLELDDARSALQQRHRDMLDLDYDRAEVEDWSLSLSCDDLRDDYRRKDPATPGQLSLSTLPSIREDDQLGVNEEAVGCVWPDYGWNCDVSPPQSASVSPSPPASWSSGGSDIPEEGRQSAPPGDEMDRSGVGIDFTRDFYRLVKYESTKSLASDVSQPPPDRERALRSVLDFIAEQRKYCREREESDSRPISQNIDTLDIKSDNQQISPEKKKCKYNDCAQQTGDESPIDFSLLENEADEKYLKRIQESNVFIRVTDSSNDTDNELEDLSFIEPMIRQDETTNTNEMNIEQTPTLDSKLQTNIECSPKSKRNGIALENNFLDEVLNACRRNSSLLPLVEEDEVGNENRLIENKVSNENSSPTNVSTRSSNKSSPSESPSRSDIKKVQRSRIPTPAVTRRQQKKQPSRIPVAKINTTPQIQGETSLNFLENGTSKDVIEELNRLIRQNEGTNPSVEEINEVSFTNGNKDNELWCPSGWVRIDNKKDYSDPKARASYLDVMVTSSDSSPSPDAASTNDDVVEEKSEGEDYQKLHHIHRKRRQRKAERGLAVLRVSSMTRYRRPCVLGRNDLFVRYGPREREAVASFDFLDHMSSGSAASSPETEYTETYNPDGLYETELNPFSTAVSIREPT